MSTYSGKGLGHGGPRVAKPEQTRPPSPSEDLEDLEDLEDNTSADDIMRKQKDEFTEYLRELFKKNATLMKSDSSALDATNK
jgi:hypothetical protein